MVKKKGKLSLILQPVAVSVSVGDFYVEIGWFRGEDLRLVSLDICRSIGDGVSFTLVNVSVLKFSFGIGW